MSPDDDLGAGYDSQRSTGMSAQEQRTALGGDLDYYHRVPRRPHRDLRRHIDLPHEALMYVRTIYLYIPFRYDIDIPIISVGYCNHDQDILIWVRVCVIPSSVSGQIFELLPCVRGFRPTRS